MTTLYVQSPTLYLAGSGIVIGATSATLTDLVDIYGNVLTMADFGDLGYITFEPDTSNAEAATFTGVTANANGTYTLTGLKTILAKSPYTQTSGAVRNHAGGTKVVVTDNVGFWETFINKNNNATVVGKITFPNGANRPVLDADTDTATTTAVVTYGQLSRTVIAGGVPATTTTLGYVKVSTNPVSALSPIAVGDNDTRVPTQGENDALVGTSGTPSSSNKFVTNDDTSATPSASKVVRYNSSGLLGSSYNTFTMTAVESITAGDAVSAYYYQSDGGVMLDTKSTANGGTGAISTSFTVGNNSNRVLVIFLSTQGGADFTGDISYNGVAMTRQQTQTAANWQRTSVFTLVAPSTGANNITFTNSSSAYEMSIYSFYNCVQSIDNSATAAASSQTVTLTAQGGVEITGVSASSAPTGGVNMLTDQQTTSGQAVYHILSGDTGHVVGALSFTVSATGGSHILSVGLAPITAPSYGYAAKASAASVLNAAAALNAKYNAFIGVSQTTTSALGTITVQSSGVVTGLSSLTPFVTYYLQDVAGSIGTTAGTNSKKIGTSTGTTTLIIKLDN